MQRTLNAKYNPGRWTFFGGKVEKGETPIQGMLREAKEELDIVPDNPRLLFESEYNYPEGAERIYLFVQEFSEDMKLNQKEGRARGWYSINAALKLDLSPDIRIALEKMAKLWL